MEQDHRHGASDAADRDGLAAIAILIVTVVLVALAINALI